VPTLVNANTAAGTPTPNVRLQKPEVLSEPHADFH
jgi:hypothetical protein